MSDLLNDLPHGPSFRFVDEIVALDPGKSGSALYYVRGDEAFLEGHFPGNPMMPGVILIEALAQLAGVVAQSDPGVEKLSDVRLTAVRQSKILGSAVPGETMEISVSIDGRMGALIQASGTITVGEVTILKAGVVLSGSE